MTFDGVDVNNMPVHKKIHTALAGDILRRTMDERFSGKGVVVIKNNGILNLLQLIDISKSFSNLKFIFIMDN